MDPKALSHLVAAIDRLRPLTQAFGNGAAAPQSLIETLARRPDRSGPTVEELHKIMRVKLSGLYAEPTIQKHAHKHTVDRVKDATVRAFSANDSREAIAALLTLGGIGVPTASAVLAWSIPERYAVIDRRAWTTLRAFELLGAKPRQLRPLHYSAYLQVVRAAAESVGLTPQKVDLWPYAFDKCQLTPSLL